MSMHQTMDGRNLALQMQALSRGRAHFPVALCLSSLECLQ